MNIPTTPQCYQFFRETEMLDHIAAHSIQVCRVALLLTDHINNGTTRLDRNLVRASALLHDITKTRSIRTGERHADTGGEFLTERGYPEVGSVVRQHVRLDLYSDDSPVTEAEVVNYADKRVLHDQVALLADRLSYIMERYGTTPELRGRLEKIWKKTETLEQKLFRALPFSPEALIRQLPTPDCKTELSEYLHAPDERLTALI
ncbi:hypothetical protein DENIS_0835 [Desulfonema ishimotonii]|uniref:HD/PDEase domain-containing protein n=1 Tax=Desulfonema ishimotonii TaxID=45657 RepID=A0A401FSG5_9BACT|nr:HD domain-containing protein [Desulfonema ishimotonii]GBC59893.1 hypothetical protein DENIS_0835 [Desulfonema ishimotonii]